jgi:amino acid adenylation domain-containing protein
VTGADDPAGRWLPAGFLRSAKRHPEALALWIGERTWTYRELEDVARRWAAALVEAGGGTPARVGVLGARSEVSYGGVLAALLAGAAFVPLNPGFPPARTAAMMASARLDAVIAERSSLGHLRAALSSLPQAPPVVVPDSDGGDAGIDATVLGRGDVDRIAPLGELPGAAPEAIAYLLFTSGSTGTPKGVPISHANVAHFLGVTGRRYALTPEDRLTQTFEQTFDLSVFDLFMAWQSGACVCPLEPVELLAPFGAVAARGITVWFSVPTAATLVRRTKQLRAGSLPALRWSLFCGEALTAETAAAWQEAAPNSVVENLYGPTECTIACLAYRWDRSRSPAECVNGLVPIGRPFDGIDAVVLGEDARPGGSGELCIAGPQTFAGYWGDPDTTARAFADLDGHRFYRTGDRVVVASSGDHAFLGRLDHQVKVLGHRVELGDIEATLRADPRVTDAVALPERLDGATAASIVAFVAGTDIDAATVERNVRERLPAHMVPRAIEIVGELPRNASGKIDRDALRRLVEEGG